MQHAFIRAIQFDRRSKQSLSDQLYLELYRAITERRILSETALPSIVSLANDLAISPQEVQDAYNRLLDQDLITVHDAKAFVKYRGFSHDYMQYFDTVVDSLEVNGYKTETKRHPFNVIEKSKVRFFAPEFSGRASVKERRTDYYGDGRIFAVTLEYFEDTDSPMHPIGYHPDSDTIKRFYHSVILPDFVCDAFGIPHQQAALMVEIKGFNRKNEWVYLYKGYISNQYTQHMNHIRDRVLEANA